MVADAEDVPPITASPIPNCHWLLQFLTAEIYPSSLIQTFPNSRAMIANSSFLNIHQLQCRFPLSRGTRFDRRSYNLSSRAPAMVGWLPDFPACRIALFAEFKAGGSCSMLARCAESPYRPIVHGARLRVAIASHPRSGRRTGTDAAGLETEALRSVAHPGWKFARLTAGGEGANPSLKSNSLLAGK